MVGKTDSWTDCGEAPAPPTAQALAAAEAGGAQAGSRPGMAPPPRLPGTLFYTQVHII